MSKTVLITGASSGFGKATAERLAKHGYTVYGTSRKEVSDKNIHFLVMDVRDRQSVKEGVTMPAWALVAHWNWPLKRR